MKNCIYLKIKLSRILYCKKKNKEIKIGECSDCKYKEYPKKVRFSTKKSGYRQKSPVIVKKSKKLNKLERNRFSILTDDLNHCIICNSKKEHLHEICFGKNRLNSIKYGLVIPLCSTHHAEMHRNKEWQNYWHKKGQTKFNEVYPDLDFIEIFKRNYL